MQTPTETRRHATESYSRMVGSHQDMHLAAPMNSSGGYNLRAYNFCRMVGSTSRHVCIVFLKSGCRDSDSEPHAPKARTLPIELHPVTILILSEYGTIVP